MTPGVAANNFAMDLLTDEIMFINFCGEIMDDRLDSVLADAGGIIGGGGGEEPIVLGDEPCLVTVADCDD